MFSISYSNNNCKDNRYLSHCKTSLKWIQDHSNAIKMLTNLLNLDSNPSRKGIYNLIRLIFFNDNDYIQSSMEFLDQQYTYDNHKPSISTFEVPLQSNYKPVILRLMTFLTQILSYMVFYCMGYTSFLSYSKDFAENSQQMNDCVYNPNGLINMYWRKKLRHTIRPPKSHDFLSRWISVRINTILSIYESLGGRM